MSSQAEKWIDVHAHFTLPSTPEERMETWRAMRAADCLLPEPWNWTPQGALHFMDKTGVQMQMLSCIPVALDVLRAANDYAASLVTKYPSRFGFLAALPTNDVQAALEEIKRASSDLNCDGFAVTMHYMGVYLSDPSLQPMWKELNERGATVFMHPNTSAKPSLGRPIPLIEVAFETARTLTDMIYAGVFLKYPKVRFIAAHCGGAFPALSGRLLAIGTEVWVPNPTQMTRENMEKQMKQIYVDTAVTATVHTLSPAIAMCGCEHIVYGSDSGVPCSSLEIVNNNRESLLNFAGLTKEEIQGIGRRGLELFPAAAKRVGLT